ncbi:unnamed protein product [Lampetra fluviatilis]
MSWYVGPLSRAEAEALLAPAVPGAFLVRDSRSCPGELALSVAEASPVQPGPVTGYHQQQHHRTARISHYIINRAGGELRMGDRRFGSLDELVEHYRRHRLDTTTLLVPGSAGAGAGAGAGGGGGAGGGSNVQEVAERRARSECSGSGTLRRHNKARPHRSTTTATTTTAVNNNNHQQHQQQHHDHNNDLASSSSTATIPGERQAYGPPRGLNDGGRDNASPASRQRCRADRDVTPAVAAAVAAVSSRPVQRQPWPLGPVPGCLVRALYDFDGKDTEDLAFRRGETLTVVAAGPAQGQWWTAANERGRVGQIPMNYVELLPLPPPPPQGAAGEAVRPRGEEEEGARWRRGGGGGGGAGAAGAAGGVSGGHSGSHGGGLLGVRVPVYARVVQDRTPTPYDTSALRLKVGEVVKVVRVDVSGQWEGEVAGRRGFFPFTHVQLLPPGPPR